MCHSSYSKAYKDIKPENIWNLWNKSENWLKWHTGLKSCRFEKDFKVGNYIVLDHEGVGIVRILITEIETGKKFTCKANFFGSQINYTRMVEETLDGAIVTCNVSFTGILKWWRYLMMKDKLVDCMQHDADLLVEIAKKEKSS